MFCMLCSIRIQFSSTATQGSMGQKHIASGSGRPSRKSSRSWPSPLNDDESSIALRLVSRSRLIHERLELSSESIMHISSSIQRQLEETQANNASEGACQPHSLISSQLSGPSSTEALDSACSPVPKDHSGISLCGLFCLIIKDEQWTMTLLPHSEGSRPLSMA